MATARDMANQKKADIAKTKREFAAAKAEAEALNNSTLTDAAQARIESLIGKLNTLKERITELQGQADYYDRMAAEDAEYLRLSSISSNPSTRVGAAKRTASFTIARNQRTYNPGNDPSGREFLLDVSRSAIFNDEQSRDRLNRHMTEETVERGTQFRAAGTGGAANTENYGVGLIVPSYLVDLYAPAVANMRPLANVAAHHDLPPTGMTLNLSRITTATSAALQAAQLDDVSHTSLAETDLAINVQTAAGRQNISRQAIERGVGIEQVTMQDLMKRVATEIDNELINQATTGILNTAQAITWTEGSPDGPKFWPYIFQAQSKLEQTLFAQAPVDYVVMHNRRWNWLASQTSTSWPFLGGGAAAPQFAMQVTSEYGPSVRGVLSNGLKVVVDANVPTTVNTTQDVVFVIASQEIHLWEEPGSPLLIRAEQPLAANLGVQLVVYSYWAATAGRYANNPAKITGSGLAAPTGF